MEKIKKHKEYLMVFTSFLAFIRIIEVAFGSVYMIHLLNNNFTTREISIVIAIFSLCLFIFDYPTGNISDRIGRKASISYGHIIWGIGLIVYGYSSKFYSILFSIILVTLGNALFNGSPISWFVTHLESLGLKKEKQYILPKIRSFTLLLGLSGGLLILWLQSTTTVLIVIGIISITWGGMTFYISDDNFGKQNHSSLIKDISITTKEIIGNQKILNYLINSICLSISTVAGLKYWQLYYNSIGGDSKKIGLYLIMFLSSMSIGLFINSLLIKKYNLKRIYFFSLIISICSFLILVDNKSLWSFLCSIMIFQFSIGIRSSTLQLHLLDLIPIEKSASYFSALSSLGYLISFGSTLFIGLMISNYSFQLIWILSLISLVFSSYYGKQIAIND